MIGQARNFYQYAAVQIGNGTTEDTLAYLRGGNEFKNCLLVEQPNGHWGTTIMRQFLFSAYQYPLFLELKRLGDEKISAIAEKSLKEITYHLRWSSEWVIRLGRGTDESHKKMHDAIGELWKYTEDMLTPALYDPFIERSDEIANRWNETVNDIFSKASLKIPDDVDMITGGKESRHTRHLVDLLNEMQCLQRQYPGVQW
jgi:ring-1,2-phenylacetyl-CoA epoxidase subunit PaaC